MTSAFVLINADLGTEKEILQELGKIENVKEAYFVYGIYDIIVKIEAESIEKVKETVTKNIRRLENVRSTLTMIVVEK